MLTIIAGILYGGVAARLLVPVVRLLSRKKLGADSKCPACGYPTSVVVDGVEPGRRCVECGATWGRCGTAAFKATSPRRFLLRWLLPVAAMFGGAYMLAPFWTWAVPDRAVAVLAMGEWAFGRRDGPWVRQAVIKVMAQRRAGVFAGLVHLVVFAEESTAPNWMENELRAWALHARDTPAAVVERVLERGWFLRVSPGESGSGFAPIGVLNRDVESILSRDFIAAMENRGDVERFADADRIVLGDRTFGLVASHGRLRMEIDDQVRSGDRAAIAERLANAATADDGRSGIVVKLEMRLPKGAGTSEVWRAEVRIPLSRLIAEPRDFVMPADFSKCDP